MSETRAGEKLKAISLALAVAAAALATTFAAPALAGTEGNTAAFGAAGNDELADKNVTVGNDTQSVYVELDDTSDGENATGNVNVTVYGVDDGGNETQVDKVQLQPDDDGEAELYEYTSINTSQYGEYRVLAEGNSTDSPSSAVTVGTIEMVAGSGGGGGSLTSGSGLDMTLMGIPVVLLAAAGGGLLLARRD